MLYSEISQLINAEEERATHAAQGSMGPERACGATLIDTFDPSALLTTRR